MAISNAAGILAMLKVYYAKEGLVNLFYRNDPFLKMIKKERVEGKSANFSALFSRGGAVSGSYLTAKRLAANTAQAKEFAVTPGQIFSSCTFNNKEILASKTQKGAYINVASAKFFANAESFRKTLAVALYGSGHGELFTYAYDADDVIPAGNAGAVQDFTFPNYAIMGVDIGSELEIKDTKDSTTVAATLTVTKFNGSTITASVKEAMANDYPLAGKVVCLSGCTGSDGAGLLPVGLAGWLPSEDIDGNDSFFGVNRSEARERLAGTVITSEVDEKKYESIERAILAVRRMGGLADIVVMNDEDRLALGKELEQKTYFPKTGSKSKANVGFEGIGFSVSTSWVDTVIDSPYCPKGTAYVISSDTVELWTYTNADKTNDGISNNEPGKPDVTGDTDLQNRPYQLLVDDMFSITPGTDTQDGAAALVALNFFGSFVITNPSCNAVIKF